MTEGNTEPRTRRVALVGNPNSGKTALFNALTGLRHKVANYPGVTVEKKEGRMILNNRTTGLLVDLPGTYSLSPHSPDEQVTIDVVLGRASHTMVPDLVVCVVDACHLERNLYLVSQLIDRHLPVVVALNMVDVAAREGLTINETLLSTELGVPVIPTVAHREEGIEALRAAITTTTLPSVKARQWHLPDPVQKEYTELAGLLQTHQRMSAPAAFHEAIALLTSDDSLDNHSERYARELLEHVRRDHQKLDFLGYDRQSVFIESRYEWIRGVCARTVSRTHYPGSNPSDRIDRVLTHRLWGFAIFVALMTLMFQGIFDWATVPMNWITDGFDWLGHQIAGILPPGDLRGLLVDGALAGVAAVVTFLPQIVLLFFFLGLLEDTGYMARAAFIMDKVMSKVGLHGRSFIPLLSSFACAIPGIMSTRTIEHPKDRLATMLVAPLVSCSARLPVYTLLIAAFVPNTAVFGFFSLPGLTLLSLYMLGLLAALSSAWAFKKTFLRGPEPTFVMELPAYKLPSLKSILLQVWDRAWVFLKRAGTFILGVSIVLWFLASYPKLDKGTPSEQLVHSFAGRAGQFIEPVLRPLGFDWRIGIGLIGSILQREVFVSTMGTIYNVQDAHDSGESLSLQQRLRETRDPVTGRPTFTLLTAMCLMIYYAFAMQCMSTFAIMRRETNSWKWPLFQLGYMSALAYGATFVAYRIGLSLGIGG